MWIFLALLSAIAAGFTAVVSKIGLEKVDSSAGFAVQSVVILVLTWTYVFATGKHIELRSVEPKAWGWLILAGGITTLAYLFYFGAIKAGDVSRTAPIDRLSLVFSIVLAVVFLREKINSAVIIGAGLMAVGALIIAVFGKVESG